MSRPDDAKIHYRITPNDPYAHVYCVHLKINAPAPGGQQLTLPSWIPGSYMVRDFAKGILDIKAYSNGKPLQLTKIDKQTWQLSPCDSAVEVEYRVYAWDLSVRSAHLDQNHAYFNGTSVFLEVVGQSHLPCTVEINNAPIAEAKNWKVATTLARKGAPAYGFGLYHAENYQDLIDHPVEIADFDLVSFEACGVPHDFVVTGRHRADLDRLAKDLTTICEYQIRLFGEPAPFERYLFITWAVGNGYGGLEHRASTSLICNRNDLPGKNETGEISEGYATFLGLCSHEYFHSWNVKRIQPDIPYNLASENHTPLLWAFEGITSYYDDLVLYRTGLLSQQRYLEVVGKQITSLLRTPGRHIQTVTDSSFDAWTKFYKQDENAINAITSYYNKGAIVAVLLDLQLRTLSDQKVNLDQVMVRLWQDYGQTKTPVEEFTIQNLCNSLLADALDQTQGPQVKNKLDDFFQQALYQTDDFDFEDLFAQVGIQFNLRQPASSSDKGGTDKQVQNRISLGMNTRPDPLGAKVANVLNGSSAHSAGISAGDVILAFDKIKVDHQSLEPLIAQYDIGEAVELVGFRRDELMIFSLTLEAAPSNTAFLKVSDEEKLKRWLSR